MALYSDMNGFPEIGFPVLADVQDRIVLNTLYYNPLKHSDYKLDVVGNSRLFGTLAISGALSGVTTLAMSGALSGVTTLGANNTVTLSHDTAPLTISGTNAVISMPGLNASIGTKLFRIRRAFFTDLDTANSPTVKGEPVMTRMDCVQCANVQNAYADGKVTQTITDGVTTSAPSQNAVYDALALKANTNNVLALNNTTAFTPDADYEPATKKYVDDNAGGGSAPDFDIASMSWADVVETGTTLYTSMQQATGITVPTPVLINRSSSSATVSLWVNTSATFTGAKELLNDLSTDSALQIFMFIPNLYYGFKISGIPEYDALQIDIYNSKTLSLIDSVYVEHYIEGGP